MTKERGENGSPGGGDLTGFVLWVARQKAKILVEGEVLLLSLPGRWHHGGSGAKPLAPGDRVSMIREPGGLRVVDVLERRNHFTRYDPGLKPIPLTIAANLDLVVVIAAAAQPRTSEGLVDRLLVTAAVGGANSALVINKIDLADDSSLNGWLQIYRGVVSQIIFTSAKSEAGVNELRNMVKGKVALLAGASGVGKSSLANRIDPNLDLHTALISVSSGKGKHITSATELHPTLGGWLGDTPGLRECAPWGAKPDQIVDAFPEIAALAAGCHYRNCNHLDDARCAVAVAVGSGRLPRSRYETYCKLMREALQPRAVRYATTNNKISRPKSGPTW